MIIGSVAMKHWFPEFNREPKDIDVILGQHQKWDTDGEYRLEILQNPILLEYYNNDMPDYCPSDILLTLKMSHLFWDLNWEKHMFDTQFLLGKGILYNKDLFYKLYEHWNQYHKKNKRSDLKMTADKFFNNAIKFPVGHDELHYLLVDRPAFLDILKDGEDVDVCEHKFNLLNHEKKCNLVTEEIMVMALERYSNLHYRQAYSKMFKKFIISHAPLWEALFIIENFKQLYKPKFNYFNHLNQKIYESVSNY